MGEQDAADDSDGFGYPRHFEGVSGAIGKKVVASVSQSMSMSVVLA